MSEQCIMIASAAQSHIKRQGDTPVTTQEYLQQRQVNVAVLPLMVLIQ